MKVSDKELFRMEMSRLAARRRVALLRGAVSVLATSALFLFVLLAFLHIFFSGSAAFPIFAFSVFWAGMAASLIIAALPDYFRPAGGRQLALILDGKIGRYRTLIRSAREFSDGTGVYSQYLIRRTIDRALDTLRSLGRTNLFEREGRAGWAAAGLILSLLALMQVILMPDGTSEILSAVADPSISFRDRGKSNIMISSGNIQALEGTEVELEGIQFGAEGPGVSLMARQSDGIWREYAVEADTVIAGGLPVSVYRRRFENPRSGFDYFFRSTDGVSDTMRVDIIHRPVINRIGAVLDYPDYTGKKDGSIEMLAGGMKLLDGTVVTVEGDVSKGIREGRLLFASGMSLPVEISGRSFSASFAPSADDTFSAIVTDSLGYSSRRRVNYPLKVVEDRAPDVEIEYPPSGEHLPRSMIVELHYRAADDFALSSVELAYKKAGRDDEFRSEVLFRGQGELEDSIEESYQWSLEGNEVMPGDRILYYLEAYDNNTLTGPGHARTEVRHLLVPSLAQMYAQHREQEMGRRDQLEEARKSGEEAREMLRELSQKFKSEGKMNWARKQEGQELIRKYRELREKVSEVVSGFEESLNTLQQNRMTSMEVGRKLEQIRDLVSRIENRKLADMIEKMNRIMNELSEDEINSAMNDVEKSMEDMLKSMDRTIEYLKDIMREEKLEAMMRRMEDMLEKQKKLRDSTRVNDPRDMAGDQKKLGREAGDFEKELSEFMKEEQEIGSELAARAESSKLDSLMMEAAGQMSRSMRDSATCTQQSSINNMLNLYTCMGKCQANMNRQVDEKMIAAMERAAGELLLASKIQEEIVREFGEGGSGRELIDRQLVVKGAVRRVSDDLYRAFSGASIMLKAVFNHLGAASSRMDRVLSASQNYRDPTEKLHAERAMTSLNRAVMEMLKASSSQGSSSAGMKKQMRGMMQQQFSIDDRLRQMYMDGNRSSLSMEQRSEMARIAAKQRKLEELMKQIEGQSSGNDDLLGDITGLSEEMDSVAARMERGELDGRLLDRENRILSRMLQAQRSINRRDYKQKRSSRSAEFLWGEEGERFIPGEADSEELLRMIRKGMKEAGPGEYRELIRLYFRALSERVREGGEGN